MGVARYDRKPQVSTLPWTQLQGCKLCLNCTNSSPCFFSTIIISSQNLPQYLYSRVFIIVLMLDSQAPLVNRVAKLDIKDILESSHSPPSPQSSQPPPYSRSLSAASIHTQHSSLQSPSTSFSPHYSSPTGPPNPYDRGQPHLFRQHPPEPVYPSGNAPKSLQQNANLNPAAAVASASAKRPAPSDHRPISTPKKKGKNSKWSVAENALVIQLRGAGQKWSEISKQMDGRTGTSCRLHYQNYLERRASFGEEKKNKLARVYERYEFPSALCFPSTLELFLEGAMS